VVSLVRTAAGTHCTHHASIDITVMRLGILTEDRIHHSTAMPGNSASPFDDPAGGRRHGWRGREDKTTCPIERGLARVHRHQLGSHAPQASRTPAAPDPHGYVPPPVNLYSYFVCITTASSCDLHTQDGTGGGRPGAAKQSVMIHFNVCSRTLIYRSCIQ
jgi:hypothetical protein